MKGKIITALLGTAAVGASLLVATPAFAATGSAPDGSVGISVANQTMRSGCFEYPMSYSVNTTESDNYWNLVVTINKAGASGDVETAWGSTSPSSGNMSAWLCDNVDGLGTYTVTATLDWYDDADNSHETTATTTFALTAVPKPVILASHITLASPAVVHRGHYMTLTGKLIYKPGSVYVPARGYVYIFTTPNLRVAHPVWKYIGRAYTNTAGNYALRYKPAKTGYYGVAYGGSTRVHSAVAFSYTKVV